MTRQLVVIAQNIRSAHNVGALLRTCEGLAVEKLYLTGHTPYPLHKADIRLPHLAQKVHNKIRKTALGAEQLNHWEFREDVTALLAQLKEQGYSIAALEQVKGSLAMPSFVPPKKLAIILGSETTGIDKEILKRADFCLEIPMLGKKESFNVVEAASMALYHCRFYKS